jgi:O-succinylbenzoate synthase
MKASYYKHVLQFKKPSGTSRGVMTHRDTWMIKIQENGKTGIGECSMLRGLSYDDRPDFEDKLQWVCDNIHLGEEVLCEMLTDYPAIQFGVETAFLSLRSDDPFILYPSAFTKGEEPIDINGLVWMGTAEQMKTQITEKIEAGFTCVKLKIGAIAFERELELLSYIRGEFDESHIEIRVDANGGFSSNDALNKLNQLAGFQIHSIEQPIAQKQTDNMSELCKSTPIPIALDEELIGVTEVGEKEKLIAKIRPQYIILKPGLVGGFRGCLQWIRIAEKYGAGWWITSALESNVGLNAIAQWTYTLKNPIPQGLGTGALYTNNFDCPLEVSSGKLWYRSEESWNFPFGN